MMWESIVYLSKVCTFPLSKFRRRYDFSASMLAIIPYDQNPIVVGQESPSPLPPCRVHLPPSPIDRLELTPQVELQVSKVGDASDTTPAYPGGAPLPPSRGRSIPVPGRYKEARVDGQNLVLFLRPMPAHSARWRLGKPGYSLIFGGCTWARITHAMAQRG